jgi:hypothetical protein
MDGDDKTTTSLPQEVFHHGFMADVCLSWSGPHVAEWDCILGRKPRIANQIKSNQIKSFSLQSPRSTVHGPPFSIATGG